MRSALALGLLCLLGPHGLASNAHAAALDLTDPTPRWIEIAFEVSPPEAPGRLDSQWSEPRRAFLEPEAGGDQIRIRVPADEIEAHLLSTGTEVVPGSFSEFVWTLERATGHVLAARLSGRVRERLRLGLFSTALEVDIRVAMTTQARAGFRSARGALGIETHDFCSPERPLEGCVFVEARELDPERGYVNAVGRVVAATPMIEVQTFSPLGEVRFSERKADGAPEPNGPAVVSSPPPSDPAVCSRELDRRCSSDRGGES
jgi:hypothetical protein